MFIIFLFYFLFFSSLSVPLKRSRTRTYKCTVHIVYIYTRMKHNDIITVSRTDVGFVSSHRNVKFTIHRQSAWPEPRERVKNIRITCMNYNFFEFPSLVFTPTLPPSVIYTHTRAHIRYRPTSCFEVNIYR